MPVILRARVCDRWLERGETEATGRPLAALRGGRLEGTRLQPAGGTRKGQRTKDADQRMTRRLTDRGRRSAGDTFSSTPVVRPLAKRFAED